MRRDFPDKEIIAPEFRLLMRSRHIYILFSALFHILLGLYLQIHPPARRTVNFWFRSLFAASLLSALAFVDETYATGAFSEISRCGLYACLGAVLSHLVAGVWLKRAPLQK